MIGAPLLQAPLFPKEELIPRNPEFNLKSKERECLHLLKRCNDVEELKQVHSRFVKLGLFWSSPFSTSSILSACALSGWEDGMDYADSVFRVIDDPCAFDFNTMIRGYVKESRFEEALDVYNEMIERGIEPDNFTYPALLKACTRMKAVRQGKQIHGHVFKLGLDTDIYVQNGLIHMYGKCGEIALSRAVFEKLEAKTVASWSSVISAHAGEGMWIDCLRLFQEMCREDDLRAEESALVSALSACANTGYRNLGMSIHGFLLRNISEHNIIVETSLIDMYGKCGCLDKASRVFNQMETRNNLTYSAMISGLALHGQGEAALRTFSEMAEEEGFEPDHVVYVSVLNACSHSGLVKEGLQVFEKMMMENKVEPTVQHYGCLVDLLGRAGLLGEAMEIIQSMPVEQNEVVWRNLLSSCRVHRNTELGQIAARELLKLNSHNPGDYLLISNMYSQAQMWEDVARVRTEMAVKGLAQIPGFSLVEVKGKTYRFVSQDRAHPQSKEIYKMIHQMEWQLKFEGYSQDTTQVTLNVEEEEKRDRLKGHSQKLAIAFALLYTSPGSTIRIARNLRMCGDCHTYTKMISMIYEREIVVRDKNRFHHFKGGVCSCKDYW
ncbi:PREDICTED: pentatricopeptide repeat-containing protein At1g31920 [Tarenaya hassleriana]|uniref:pentatricopeptide repeat-containing protein At1g31920 n=1 Tax=Tarenaya hassleriana TaxID=28532 RepID=UPI00053C55BF|nr:PREDICTED: pentatricopeptide repeat-containing protein At1g31920 [Tarenaya hassleriana]